MLEVFLVVINSKEPLALTEFSESDLVLFLNTVETYTIQLKCMNDCIII